MVHNGTQTLNSVQNGRMSKLLQHIFRISYAETRVIYGAVTTAFQMIAPISRSHTGRLSAEVSLFARSLSWPTARCCISAARRMVDRSPGTRLHFICNRVSGSWRPYPAGSTFRSRRGIPPTSRYSIFKDRERYASHFLLGTFFQNARRFFKKISYFFEDRFFSVIQCHVRYSKHPCISSFRYRVFTEI